MVLHVVAFETGSLADSEAFLLGLAGGLAGQGLESACPCPSVLELQAWLYSALLCRFWGFPTMLTYQVLLPTEPSYQPIQFIETVSKCSPAWF